MIFTPMSYLDPETTMRQIDDAIDGPTIFTPMSRLDPGLMMRQIAAATGASFTPMSVLNPGLFLRQVDVALVGSTRPAWVPANAKIEIQFVHDRAWTEADGEVAIGALVGADENAEEYWGGDAQYNPANLTADGYVSINAVAFIGAARDLLLAGGATIVMSTKQLNVQLSKTYAMVYLTESSAFEVTIDGGAMGTIDFEGPPIAQTADMSPINVGSVVNIAATVRPPPVGICDVAIYGSAAATGIIAAENWATPTSVIMQASNLTSIRSFTIYDPFPSTDGLSELSEI